MEIMDETQVRAEAAKKTIRRKYQALTSIVSRARIPEALYEQEIISDETLEIATINPVFTNREKGNRIMSEVKRAIQANAGLFDVFCEVLAEDGTLKDLSDELKEIYKKNLEAAAEDRKSQGNRKAENKELNELKGELEVYKQRLAKTSSNEDNQALLKIFQITIQHYIETALKAGVNAETLQKHIWSLCYVDFLIPTVLGQWARDQITHLSMPTSTESVITSEHTSDQSQVTDPLFSKDTLYHASLCCQIVSTSTPGNFRERMEQMSGHTLEEASMSISETKENVDRYLIAKQKNTVYVAFQSEPTLLMWMQKYGSFDAGLEKEMNRIPLRFFIDLLTDCNRIILTGFSFGGMLACYVAANIWKKSYISIGVLERRVACITFGQPLITLPFVQDTIQRFPQFEATVHSVFDREDIVPRLFRYFRVGCTYYRRSSTSATMELALPSTSAEVPVAQLPASPAVSTPFDGDIMGFQGPFATKFLQNLAIIQEEQTYSGAASLSRGSPHKNKGQALSELKDVLKQVVAYAEPDPSIVCGTCYAISCEEGAGLTWKPVPKLMASQELGFLSIPAVDELEAILFKQHKMEEYRQKTFRSYLEKEPGRYLKPDTKQTVKQVKDLAFLKPEVKAVKFHEYPNEHVVVLEGNNLWFCHQICIGEEEINTPAQNITRQSIWFNFTPKANIVFDEGKVKVVLYSHFANPIRKKIAVDKEPYSFSLRQIQLAKHTPSEIIQLAFLSAMLEYHPKHISHYPPSRRFQAVIHFLQEAVRVVPVESVFYAVTYSNDEIALKCSKAIKASLRKERIIPSEMMVDGSQKAAVRMRTGINGSSMNTAIQLAIQQMDAGYPSIGGWIVTKLQPTRNNELIVSARTVTECTISNPVRLYSEVTRQYQQLPVFDLEILESTAAVRLPPPIGRVLQPPLDVIQCLEQISEVIATNVKKGLDLSVICNLNIEQVYPIDCSKRECIHATALQSPDKVLKEAREKLATFVEEAQEDSESDAKASNECMLELVKEIQECDLKICAALLGAFMEQRIRIPLLESPVDTAKIISSRKAPVAVGVWALFSMDYIDLQQRLSQMEGNSLLVEIAEYIGGVISQKEDYKLPEISDRNYAGKLQFLLQGIKKTVSCSSQYISYSLEHQLCNDLKFKKSIPVKELIDTWDEIFKGDALSLVAKSHRPLTARWLKWAVLVHDLREALAKYTCVGVIGLVNSGKSQLVNTLFKVQTLVGTTKKMRTTVPFMYNMDGCVDGLDVIDFPGVDDKDDSVPGLAKILLSLAQVVIFVVDYRRIGTDAAKQWLCKLKEEEVPVLVCLTHADRLYADLIPKDKSETLEPTGFKQQQIGRELQQLKTEVCPHPSRSVEFYCFHQEPDSAITVEYLREVSIHGPKEVGEWLVKTFRKLDQNDLADNMQKFIDGQEKTALL